MAFKKNTKKTENTDLNATARITGTLEDIYEGSKYNYVKIKATRGDYYDLFDVAFPLDYPLPGDKCEVTVTASMSTFYDKAKKCGKVLLTGIACNVVSKF